MSKYDLLVNATVSGVKTPIKPQGQAVTPPGPQNPNMPTQQQTFLLEVTGNGAVSATAQILATADNGPDPSLYNWVAYGDPITATGANGIGTAIMGGTQAWRHFGAYLTGTPTGSATVRMNA